MRTDEERVGEADPESQPTVAHELRTPLSTILGFAQLLALEDLAPQQKESVEAIVKAGHRLLGLIDRLVAEDGALRLPDDYEPQR